MRTIADFDQRLTELEAKAKVKGWVDHYPSFITIVHLIGEWVSYETDETFMLPVPGTPEWIKEVIEKFAYETGHPEVSVKACWPIIEKERAEWPSTNTTAIPATQTLSEESL